MLCRKRHSAQTEIVRPHLFSILDHTYLCRFARSSSFSVVEVFPSFFLQGFFGDALARRRFSVRSSRRLMRRVTSEPS